MVRRATNVLASSKGLFTASVIRPALDAAGGVTAELIAPKVALVITAAARAIATRLKALCVSIFMAVSVLTCLPNTARRKRLHGRRTSRLSGARWNHGAHSGATDPAG